MTSLVKKIEQRVEAASSKAARPLGTYVIFVDNSEGLDQQLRALAVKESLKRVSIGICVPPADYAVASEAEVTVVIYNVARRGQQQVTANFALRRGELDEARTDAIVNAIAAVLPR